MYGMTLKPTDLPSQGSWSCLRDTYIELFVMFEACFNVFWKKELEVVKGVAMLNDCSRGYLQNCCYVKQLSMALLYVSHLPSSDLCG